MGLFNGSVTLARFMALGPAPEDEQVAAGLAQDRFRPFEDGLDEERAGWVDWRNPLLIPAEPDWVTLDRYALFTLRIDTRRVPSSLLKAHVDLRLRRLMAEKDLVRVGREARLSVQDEVKAELLKKVMPTPATIECAWDRKAGIVIAGAGSAKAREGMTRLFMKSFGVELQPMGPLILAGQVRPHLPADALAALDPFDLALEA